MDIDEIRRGLQKPGKTQRGLAAVLGVNPSAISRLLKGEREIKAREVPIIEAYLGDPRQMQGRLTPTEGLQPVGTEVVFVRGAVQAGHWLEAVELGEHDWETLFLPPDPRFPPQARYGLRVAGRSMDLVYPPDTILVCVSIHDFGEPNPGRNVIVYRRRPDGLIEATVKTLRAGKNGKPELWPQSSAPEYADPVRMDDVTDGEEVEVVGVVIGSYRRE